MLWSDSAEILAGSGGGGGGRGINLCIFTFHSYSCRQVKMLAMVGYLWQVTVSTGFWA